MFYLSIFIFFCIFVYMDINKLQKQLESVERRFKSAKCNKCAERLFRQAQQLKAKIDVLKKMDKH